MRKEILCCDQCNKQSEDICGDIDWIRIESPSGSIQLMVSNGRPNAPEDTTHTSKICKGFGPTIKQLDFCSVDCMLEWMELTTSGKTPIYHQEPKLYNVVGADHGFK